MNKFHIPISNCHTADELKSKISGLYSSLFKKNSVIFRKNGGGGLFKQKISLDFFPVEVLEIFFRI